MLCGIALENSTVHFEKMGMKRQEHISVIMKITRTCRASGRGPPAVPRPAGCWELLPFLVLFILCADLCFHLAPSSSSVNNFLLHFLQCGSVGNEFFQLVYVWKKYLVWPLKDIITGVVEFSGDRVLLQYINGVAPLSFHLNYFFSVIGIRLQLTYHVKTVWGV